MPGDTLPPEMKKAIQERRPVVGMDREELIAAMGKPDHKVRERWSIGRRSHAFRSFIELFRA